MANGFEIRQVPRWWPGPNVDNRFTDQTIAVLDDAKHQATTWKLAGIVPPLVLLCCVLRCAKLGQNALQECGVDSRAVQSDIETLVIPHAGSSSADLDMQCVHKAAVRAKGEAAALAHNWVGTEHLVLALFQDEAVGRLLEKHGVSREAFLAKLQEMLA